MSDIQKLSISHVRNIRETTVELSPTVNVLFGENGSGKTSFLEAIHLLASGRSFRSSKIDSLINHDEDEAVIFAELSSGAQIGLSKSRRQNHQLRLQSEQQRNWDRVAKLLPVQVLDSSSFLLLEGGPKARRRYLDWGVFHVEPGFLSSWRKTRKCIANRNHLLKQSRVDQDQLLAWDAELDLSAAMVDLARRTYFEKLMPEFREVYESLGGSHFEELNVAYRRGWDEDKSLGLVLAENRGMDTKRGSTQLGPHRADISIKVGIRNGVDVLSRGQQKVLVSALKIAQGNLLSKSLNERCIFLVDDLQAELDRENRAAVFNQLVKQGGQLFITCVDMRGIENSLQSAAQVTTFHVERGTITA